MGANRSRSSVPEPEEPQSRFGWPRLMWIPVAADYLGARPNRVEEMIRGGEVEYVMVGNRKCIFREDLDRWAETQQKHRDKPKSKKFDIAA